MLTVNPTETGVPLRSRDVTESFDGILADDYQLERSSPKPGDPFYLPLSDLSLAINRFRSNERMTILDYGSGGSPYRSLFPNSEYRRADVIQAEGLDYRIAEDQSIPEASGIFDLVLSTQVLEHVPAPRLYLAECHRLLRSGGRLVLSTHGTFEEHGVPFDFYRWTVEGLRKELEGAGFEILEYYRLTADGRAAAFLFEQYGPWMLRTPRNLWALALWYVCSVVAKRKAWFHRWCDAAFAASRVMDASEPGHTLTIGLLCHCVKRS
jgi:SAM-dependent methyltransferase